MTVRESPFTVTVDLNPYLADGSTDVDAIVTVTAAGAPATPDLDAVEVLIIDCSASMTGEKLEGARHACAAAIGELRDGVHFAVIEGTHTANQVFPEGGGTVLADDVSRAAAGVAVGQLVAHGGTAIGSWLRLAAQLVDRHPGAIKHAILLTDGHNQHEDERTFRTALDACRDRFGCDCRGVGTDWRVAELRMVANALLGSVDIVARPDDLAADFRALMDAAMAKAVPEVALRLWTPKDAEVRFVKQVSPSIADLTDRRSELDPLRGEYPLGAWGVESRDYHVGVRVPAGAVGEERLAARFTLVTGSSEEVLGSGRAVVSWTADSTLSTRINPAVAGYTGQAELAKAIQQGLAARKAGDERTATARLGRAVALADAAGHTETARLLAKVVDVLDAPTGTVRLRNAVTAADEMTLDTRSTRTVRVRSRSEEPE